MHFQFCPDCGNKLTGKELGDEGMVPFCQRCNKPFFDMFPNAIIALVTNELGEAALLKQNYISDKYYNLVSGYMQPGETAEETTEREIFEEIGLKISSLRYEGSHWFVKKGVLMLGFLTCAKKADFVLSCEVDGALWVPAEKAIHMVHPKGSLSYTLLEKYLNNK